MTNCRSMHGQNLTVHQSVKADNSVSDLQKMVAVFLMSEGIEATEYDVVSEYLDTLDVKESEREAVFEWLERIVRSGKPTESLDMIHQASISGIRIENPFDRAYMSDRLWKKIEGWRLRGILPADVVERLLIGLRNIDVRDWEDDDVRGLVADMLAPAFHSSNSKDQKKQKDLRAFEKKIDSSFYC